MPFRQGVAIAILSILLLPLFIIRGQRTGSPKGTAAPSVTPPPYGYIQIQGSVGIPGIYPITDNQLTATVIKLAKPSCILQSGTGDLISSAAAVPGNLYIVSCKKPESIAELRIQQMTPAAAMLMGIPFSINRATAADLDSLPDIGPRTAERIIEYRQINGGFKSLEELMMVEGIGEKRFSKIKPYLKI